MLLELNREELAWAAGFFDGEGSTCLVTSRRQPNSPSLVMSIGQLGAEALERFHRAVGGLGRVSAVGTVPGAFQYQVAAFNNVQAVLAMLWPFLSPPKRKQATIAFRSYREAPAKRRPMTKRWNI